MKEDKRTVIVILKMILNVVTDEDDSEDAVKESEREKSNKRWG